MLRKAYIFIFLLVLSGEAFSTHIVGGEMYYQCLGGNKYQVTLKLYSDCATGSQAAIDADSVGYFAVYDAIGDTFRVDRLKRLSYTIIPPANDPCIVPQGNVCVAEAIYTDTVTLPPKAGGYYIAYQRCCRNNTILNINNSGNTGSTYFVLIPDPTVVTCNNSVRFKQYPPIFLCEGIPFVYDHSGIDPDGDSLVYQLCDSYTGLTASNPGPTIPTAPPYTTVSYSAPYSGSNPMSGVPPLVIDPVTGKLTITPNLLGQWVVGICVTEYRKGKYIGTHFRDFQFNVINCPKTIVSSIPSQTTFCFGTTVNFLNSSTNAINYHWDFGVSGIKNDTSNLFTPTYNYPDTGVFVVTLIANPGLICADTATTTFKIYSPLLPKFINPAPQCVTNNSYNFNGSGLISSKSTFSWDFGVGATPATSSLQNPVGINFSTAGKHVVKFTIYDHGCAQFFQDTVVVLPPPTPKIPAQVGQCINSNSFNFAATGNITASATYSWSFGASANPSISMQQNVNGVTYSAVGKFPITLTITDNGCTVSATDTIVIYPIPVAKFDPTPVAGCNPLRVQFTDSSLSGTTIKYDWDFGDGVKSILKNPVHVYSSPGTFDVSLTIATTNGCVAVQTFTIPKMVKVDPTPDAQLIVDPKLTTISDPKITFTDQSKNSTDCKLYFGDGDSSLNCTTFHSYTQPGIYVVTQIATNQFGCPDTSYIYVEITRDSRFWIPDAFSPNGDHLNDVFLPIMDGVVTYHFMIFDRWGELLFETDDTTKGWDGTYKKRRCEEDVYVYKIDLTDIQSYQKNYVGHVTLVK